MRNYFQTVYKFTTSNCARRTPYFASGKYLQSITTNWCRNRNTSTNSKHVWFKLIIYSIQLQLIQTILYLFIQTVAFVSVYPLNIHSTECWTWIIWMNGHMFSKLYLKKIQEPQKCFSNFEIQIWMWSDVLIIIMLKIDSRI